MAKYDVVVVGAGNSGLSAAIRLILAQKKVLLIEQNNLPGGCATSFLRGRFEFDPSIHELCDVGDEDNPGGIRKLMDAYGVKVKWIKIKDCFRVISTYSDGTPMDVTMPSGVNEFIEAMEKYVPGSRESVTRLFDLMKEIQDGLHFLSGNGGSASMDVLKNEYGDMLRTGGYSVNKVFKALKLPDKVCDIMGVYWSYLGVDLDRLNMTHFAAMVWCYVEKGAYMPENTAHAISVAMLERFRELGGECRMNCRADEFLFDGNRICGVKTSGGVVECDCVLANINPDIVYGKMVPDYIVPEREKKLSAARNHNYCGCMFTCYFGLDCTAESLGIKDYSIFFYGTADTVKEYKNSNNCFKTNDFFIFVCYNVANPGFSPEGTCVVSLTTFTSPDDWNYLETSKYGWQKSKVASELIRELKERSGIDISEHIEEMVTASPLTFARYLNTPEGAVYGFETADWDNMMARMMTYREDYPVDGLYTIGAAGPRGVGYGMTYVTGKLVAELALAEMKKEEALKE